MLEMTPRQIVEKLNSYIIGQMEAKRAVAIAVRNRWRRQKVSPEMKKEIGPKNMLMIGPTGVGKTEIARRLALLTGAPFIKVEATKYTEVGYYGRDVESMVRDLVENAIGIVRKEEREKVREHAETLTENQLVELLAIAIREEDDVLNAGSSDGNTGSESDSSEGISIAETNDILKSILDYPLDPTKPDENFDGLLKCMHEALARVGGTSTDRGSSSAAIESGKTQDESEEEEEEEDEVDLEEVRSDLRKGLYEDKIVMLQVEQKMSPVMLNGIGGDMVESDLQNMFENIMPKRSIRRKVPVREARKIIHEQICEQLINKDKLNSQAIELAENLGIVFIDEIDKIVSGDKQHGADVSRQGVQRDLLPIVEGTTVQTKYGLVSTEHILFVAAGAFHRTKPTDLMPELQGRFPIRVELDELTRDDFVRILTEPEGSLVKQYAALMGTEGINLTFTDDAIDVLAEFAFEVNQTQQNIGARRLYTIMERLLEELSYESPDMKSGDVVVNADYVAERLKSVIEDEDLGKFIL